jgi:hypothetical protein
MRKTTLMIGLILMVAVVVCVKNAYAADGDTTAWQGFWNSVGGFLYNALPWNWGNWAGK